MRSFTKYSIVKAWEGALEQLLHRSLLKFKLYKTPYNVKQYRVQ